MSSRDGVTRLFVVRVAVTHAPRVVELLFEAGFSGLMEEACDDGVVLSTAADEEAEAEFTRASQAEGVRCETGHRTLNDDWRLLWTTHLQPVQVTDTLRLVPASPPPTPESGDLYLAPTLAFGFGEHATTRMATRWLERHVSGQRVLDFGCGTGVLALAAARFGAASAVGIDIDLASVEAARANALANALHDRCVFSSQRLDQLGQDFGVVVANVDVRTLEHSAADLCARLCTPGHMAVTGVLEEHCQEVYVAFQRCEKPLRVVDSNDGWCLLATSE